MMKIGLNRLGQVIAIVTIAALYYAVFFVTLYFLSALAIGHNVILPYWPFRIFQMHEYFGNPPVSGSRNIWQSRPDCVEADDYLIYKPKEGVCRFANPEFDVNMTFDSRGRVSPRQIVAVKKKAVAVLGDSHAMGWGVGDDETFSAVMAQRLKADVFNLAVSSYGTRRELRRLLASNLLEDVDTIIIQYCDNDLGENLNEFTEDDYIKLANEFRSNLAVFRQFMEKGNPYVNVFDTTIARTKFAILEPFEAIKRILGLTNGYELLPFRSDFEPHRQALVKVLDEYKSYLRDKRIIVFYSNAHGNKFKNFPSGKDSMISNLLYFQPQLDRSDYYVVDDHLNPNGHRRVAEALAQLLKEP
jgi:lysophospholipase L1-like esterase